MNALLAVLGLSTLGLGAWWAWEKRHRATHPVPPGLQRDVALDHQREFELYHNALSLCSMKVRVCLAELGIEWASHPIDLIETGAYETLSRRFLAVNPGGTVPVLVHRGHPVYESHEQIRFAADHAPPGAPALVPDDPDARARMQAWVDRASLTEDPVEHGDESAANAVPGLTTPLFAAMIEKIPYRRIAVGLLFHFDRRRPLMFAAFKALGLEGFPRLRPIVAMLRRSRRQMDVHLDALEAQLARSGGPWILGEPYTLADVSWLVVFERLAQVDLLHVFTGEGLRPRCAAYWRALQQRRAYREAIEGHTHPLVAWGTARIREAKAKDPALRAALEGGAAEDGSPRAVGVPGASRSDRTERGSNGGAG